MPTTARPTFTYPLNGDTDRQIALQIEAALDLEDSMMGLTINPSNDNDLPPTLDDANMTFVRVYEDPDYTFWGW